MTAIHDDVDRRHRSHEVAVQATLIRDRSRYLLSNAIKYGERATVVVEDGADLVLRVQDDGPGIPAESLEQVFEPFFRLESSRNSSTGGIGLGLGIARDIAQAHGGSLVLCNRSPRGLEAVLTLPKQDGPFIVRSATRGNIHAS